MENALSRSKKPQFHLSFLPDAMMGMFGIRTEAELVHTTLLSDGKFSLRRYDAHTELVCQQKGSRPAAVDRAFEPLFDYIRGANSEGKTFAMTTPVLARPKYHQRWEVSFYMKEKRAELPKPIGSELSIREVPSRHFAVVRASGNPTDLLIRKMTTELSQFVESRGLKIAGETIVAQYDQPFAIPLLKRNEVLIPISWDNAWSSAH